jgi:hypothetical protein
VTAGLGATVGGTSGIGAGAGLGVGNGVNVGLGLGVGNNPGSPTDPSNPSNPTGPKLASAVANMSDSKLARMKKRCVDVLGSQESYDRDLRQLCLMIAGR